MHMKNCWEYFQCGREPGGSHVDEFGICPATVAVDKNGINHGKAAGRICWTVEGSLCKVRFGNKFVKCLQCPFFQEVELQEGRFLVLGLGSKMKKPLSV